MNPDQLSRQLKDAINSNNVEEVRSAISNGADVGRYRFEGASFSPVLDAIHVFDRFDNDATALDMLLAAGAKTEGFHGIKKRPLHMAAARDNRPATQTLLDHGANVNSRSKTGETPLMEARSGDMAALLLDHGARHDLQDKDGNTALHHASLNLDAGVVRVLLERGADSSIENWAGETALDLLVRREEQHHQHENTPLVRQAFDEHEARQMTVRFEQDTAAVLADNFNPNATPEANLVQSDAEAPARRQRMRL